jgi:hypothetical protein
MVARLIMSDNTLEPVVRMNDASGPLRWAPVTLPPSFVARNGVFLETAVEATGSSRERLVLSVDWTSAVRVVSEVLRLSEEHERGFRMTERRRRTFPLTLYAGFAPTGAPL